MGFNQYEIIYVNKAKGGLRSKLEEGIRTAMAVLVNLGSMPLSGGRSHV